MGNELYLSYEAPKVEVIEVEVEKGFANSNTPSLIMENEWSN